MKKLRMKVLAIMVATFGLGVHAQTTFEEISADLNKAGGVYLAYPKVEAKLTPAPKGYKPFYVSHYGRHGSRYLLGDRDYLWVLQLMQKADAVNGLTTLGKDVLNRLEQVWAEAQGRGGDLTPLGVRQHQGRRHVEENITDHCGDRELGHDNLLLPYIHPPCRVFQEQPKDDGRTHPRSPDAKNIHH